MAGTFQGCENRSNPVILRRPDLCVGDDEHPVGPAEHPFRPNGFLRIGLVENVAELQLRLIEELGQAQIRRIPGGAIGDVRSAESSVHPVAPQMHGRSVTADLIDETATDPVRVDVGRHRRGHGPGTIHGYAATGQPSHDDPGQLEHECRMLSDELLESFPRDPRERGFADGGDVRVTRGVIDEPQLPNELSATDLGDLNIGPIVGRHRHEYPAVGHEIDRIRRVTEGEQPLTCLEPQPIDACVDILDHRRICLTQHHRDEFLEGTPPETATGLFRHPGGKGGVSLEKRIEICHGYRYGHGAFLGPKRCQIHRLSDDRHLAGYLTGTHLTLHDRISPVGSTKGGDPTGADEIDIVGGTILIGEDRAPLEFHDARGVAEIARHVVAAGAHRPLPHAGIAVLER